MNEKTTRQAIMDCGRDLLIRHGYRGASFGDIAGALGMTRANIHYHFGSKQALVEAVLDAYLATTMAALSAIWLDRQMSFAERVERMLAFSLERYRRYNKAGAPPSQWSLISRLRQDVDLLTPRARSELSAFSSGLRQLITQSLEEDVEQGGFEARMPIASVASQLTLIADNASAVTLDADGADNLAELYRGLVAVVEGSYGRV
jgi:TetR/AcrR family transcriptional repressor of nem operon